MQKATNSTETGGMPLPSRPVRITVRARHLVRCEEQSFRIEIAKQLQIASVDLDLSGGERMDAAGISALVQLYALAHDLGRSLRIISASRHVSEILTMVGLGPLLLYHTAIQPPHSGPFSESAAA